MLRGKYATSWAVVARLKWMVRWYWYALPKKVELFLPYTALETVVPGPSGVSVRPQGALKGFGVPTGRRAWLPG
jgi:hypothetical protein